VFLGGGARLFSDHLTSAPVRLSSDRVLESPVGVAHLRYAM
jgi:hypothetical protein